MAKIKTKTTKTKKTKDTTKGKRKSQSYRAKMYDANKESIAMSIASINANRRTRKQDSLPAGTTVNTAGWFIETEKWLKSIGCGDVELALVMYGMITGRNFNTKLNKTTTTTSAQSLLKSNQNKVVRGKRGKLSKRRVTYHDVLKNPNSQLYAYTVLFQIDFVYEEGTQELAINNIVKDARLHTSFVQKLHFNNTKSSRKQK